jgi:hypothetical protein
VKLALAEFTYNNSKYSIIGISLFYVLYEFYSNIKLYIKDNILEEGALVIYKRI